MTTLITAKTLTTAFRDHARMTAPKGETGARPKRYDVSDSRISGLELRVKPSGVRWCARARLHGKQHRYDLGPAVAGDVDVGGLCLDGARARASRVAEMVRNGHNPATYLAAVATGVSIETQRKIESEKPKQSWTWETAKKNFLADVERTRREDTLRDYKGKLRPAELDRFAGRNVDTITRNEMAKAIAAVHARGAETMAKGMVRVVKRMWTWLAKSVRQDHTGVADGVMIKLEPPEPTRIEVGEPQRDKPADKTKVPAESDAPAEIEIGRVLAIARLGCLPERIGLGLELLIGTAQRRRTVTGANRNDFKRLAMSNSESIWSIPPYFRKSGSKRGERYHLVPVVGFAAQAAARLDPLSDSEAASKGWLFPAGQTNRSGRPHAEAGLFNDYLSAMPGVNWSPHGARYALASYGERDLGFAKGEGRLILDHMEGVDPKDVTSQFYSSDPGIARKLKMMRDWTDWCDDWAAKAIKADPLLLDADLMAREIRSRRYKKPGVNPEFTQLGD